MRIVNKIPIRIGISNMIIATYHILIYAGNEEIVLARCGFRSKKYIIPLPSGYVDTGGICSMNWNRVHSNDGQVMTLDFEDVPHKGGYADNSKSVNLARYDSKCDVLSIIHKSGVWCGLNALRIVWIEVAR